MVHRRTILVAVLAAAASCQPRPAAVPAQPPTPTGLPAPSPAPDVAASPAPETAPETSVKPGANAQFLTPDLRVDEWAARFETESREVYAHREAIVRATSARPGARVADIGAGTGLFTLLFARAVGPEGRVFAVDIAPRFLEHIERRAREAKLANVQVVRGTERSVDLPPASVDVAFVCDTYHHFEFPRSSLASIHQALRPEGELFIVDFKRIPGQSAGWIFDHVRAGQEVFTAEIKAAGFEQVEELPLLKENYVLRFRKR